VNNNPTPETLFVPPAADGLPLAALDSATEGADRLDAMARTPYGRNLLAHALVQLARDGWLHEPAVPAAGLVAVPPTNQTAARHAESAEALRSDLYDDLDAFARQTGIPGLQHAQIRDHLAVFLAEGLLRCLAAETQPDTQAASTLCPDPIECDHEAALGQARETNRRLNLRAQALESELATYRRAVAQWETSDRGTYVPLRTIAAIAKAAGRDIETPSWLLHYQRVEQAEAAIARVRMVIATHRAHLELTDPILLSKLDRAVTSDQPAAVSAVGQTDTEADHA
jgi:hypothetical protein